MTPISLTEFLRSSSPTLFGRISTNPSLLVLSFPTFLSLILEDVPYGDISNDEFMAKLTCLGSGYELWANMAMGAVTYIDDIISAIDEIEEPKKIKQYLNPTRDVKSLQLAMANGPFGAMTHVQSNNYPVAARVLKNFFQFSLQIVAPPFSSFPSGNVMLQLNSN